MSRSDKAAVQLEDERVHQRAGSHFPQIEVLRRVHREKVLRGVIGRIGIDKYADDGAEQPQGTKQSKKSVTIDRR